MGLIRNLEAGTDDDDAGVSSTEITQEAGQKENIRLTQAKINTTAPLAMTVVDCRVLQDDGI